MAKFKARLVAPTATDKHWIHTSKGGLNECIIISGSSCIPNCVGYAWGRFYEIIGKRPNLSRGNAEMWYGTNDGYKRSKNPVPGAVICWAKGKVGNSSDGAGHVAIVEEVKANGDIVTSNSGYRSTRFWLQTFKKANGYAMKGYTFQGFILPPNIAESNPPSTSNVTPDIKTTSYLVRVSIDNLNIRAEPTVDSPSRGYIPPNVYTIVAEADGKGATKWGKLKSGAGWISLDFVTKV